MTKRHLSAAIVLFSLLGFVTACSLIGGDGDNNNNTNPAVPTAPVSRGDEIILDGEARLACTQQCSQRYQCGQANSAEGTSLVLLSTIRPSTVNHNMAVPADTAVTIASSQPETLVRLATNEQFPLNYYLVDVPERGQAWVAGWCVVK